MILHPLYIDPGTGSMLFSILIGAADAERYNADVPSLALRGLDDNHRNPYTRKKGLLCP
jgi:hypothetical protein